MFGKLSTQTSFGGKVFLVMQHLDHYIYIKHNVLNMSSLRSDVIMKPPGLSCSAFKFQVEMYVEKCFEIVLTGRYQKC